MIWSLLDFPVAVTRFGVESGSKLQSHPSGNPMIQLGLEVRVREKCSDLKIAMPDGLSTAMNDKLYLDFRLLKTPLGCRLEFKLPAAPLRKKFA